MPAGHKRGFTLIELMIVVAIIGILAAIAIPKFADLIRKSNEGTTKGNLGALRSALSIYYGDMEGYFPTDDENDPSTVLIDSLIAKYIDRIPDTKVGPYHATANDTRTHDTPYTHTHDPGYWGYGSVEGQSGWGDLWVMCSHTDSKSKFWTTY